MSIKDTPGDCPLCGHVEAGHDDWASEGYQFTQEWNGERVQVRVYRCAHCGGRVSPDYERAPDGKFGTQGMLRRFRPLDA